MLLLSDYEILKIKIIISCWRDEFPLDMIKSYQEVFLKTVV